MVFFRYANGVVVKLDNGSGGGGIFFGEKGKIDLDRGKVHTESAGDRRGDHQAGQGRRPEPRAELARLHQEPRRSPSPTSRSAIARPPSATWATSPAGPAASSAGIPVKEIFPDDAEANQYLDRERRKPYELPETI